MVTAFALAGTAVLNAAPGSLDTTFGTGGKVIAPVGSSHDYGRSVAVQDDGKIVVAGYASNGNDMDFAVARFNPDGSLDSGFGMGGKVLTPVGSGDDRGHDVAIQSDGGIVVVGSSSDDLAVVRYNPDGSPDSGFGVAGKVVASISSLNDGGNAVVLQSDGKIVVAGRAIVGGNFDIMVARFNTDGSVDDGFGTGGSVTTAVGTDDDIGCGLALQVDGKIVVGGYARMGSTDDFAVLRFTTDGAIDSGFGTNGMATTSFGSYDDCCYDVAVQADGKIVLAGELQSGYSPHIALTRYTSQGVLDGSFGNGGIVGTSFSGSTTEYGRSVAVRSDGKIFVAGGSSQSGGAFAIACFQGNGALDGSFGSTGMKVTRVATIGSDVGTSVALQDDGKVLVAGHSFVGSGMDLVLLRHEGGTVAAVPEMGVRSGAGEIVDGDSIPGTADGSDFGNAFPSGEPLTRTFTIINSGNAPLVLSGSAPDYVALSGSSSFSIAEQPTSGILAAGGGTATFSITFDPAAVGEAQAMVSIASNDGDESPFNFAISATGMQAEIAISGNEVNIANGDTQPTAADHTDFGTMFANEGCVKRTFTVSNCGGSALHFVGGAPVVVSGSGSGSFQVTRQPDTGVLQPDGGITTFEITYDPTSATTSVATVSVFSDDLDESPFTFTIRGIGRYPLPGDLDLPFNGTGKVNAPVGTGNDGGRSVAVQVDGRIVAAGNSSNGTDEDFALLRYLPDGTPDGSFGVGGRVVTPVGAGDDIAYGVALQEDGKIVVAGYAENGGNRDIAVVRYHSDGTLDNSFGGGGKVITAVGGGDDVAYDVKIQTDGRIVVVGYSFNGVDDDMAFVRYNTDGSLDGGFGNGGKRIVDFGSNNDYAESVAIQSDGNLAVAGSTFNGSNWSIALARCTSWGAMDSTFSGDGKVTYGSAGVHCFGFGLAIQADGKLVAAGNFDGSFFTVLRYNSNGTLDGGFGTSGTVTTYFSGTCGAKGVAVQNDGKIVVAGYAGGSSLDFALARYNANGSLDGTFGNSGVLTTSIGSGNDYIESVALQDEGKIVVVGTSFNGTNYDFALARYSGAGIPKIVLTGNAIGIGNGDATPRAEDGTDFGGVDFTSGAKQQTFWIRNNGSAALNLTGSPRVVLDGSSAFSVSLQPALGSLASSDRIYFKITYNPAAVGADQATVSIANNDSSATPFTFLIAGKGLSPLEAWRQQWFGTTENTGNAANAADFDTDGIVNLMEWACGLDPTSSSGSPVGLEHKGTHLEFTYPRCIAALNSGVDFTVQWSDGLQSVESWGESGVTEQVISDNGVVQMVKASVPIGVQRRFVRLQVSMSP